MANMIEDTEKTQNGDVVEITETVLDNMAQKLAGRNTSVETDEEKRKKEEEEKKKEQEQTEKTKAAQVITAVNEEKKEQQEKEEEKKEKKKEEEKKEAEKKEAEKKEEAAKDEEKETEEQAPTDEIEGSKEPFDIESLSYQPDLWKRLSYTMSNGGMGRVFAESKNPLLDKEKGKDALDYVKRLASEGNLYLRETGSDAFRRIKADSQTGDYTIGAPKTGEIKAPCDPVLGTLYRLTNTYFGGGFGFFRRRADRYNSFRMQEKTLKAEKKALNKDEKKRVKEETRERKRKEREAKKELRVKEQEERLLSRYERQARERLEKQRLKQERDKAKQEKKKEKQRLKQERKQAKLEEKMAKRLAKLRAAKMKAEEARVAKEKFAKENADLISDRKLDDINREKNQKEKTDEQWIEMQTFSPKEEPTTEEKKKEKENDIENKEKEKEGVNTGEIHTGTLVSGDTTMEITVQELPQNDGVNKENEETLNQENKVLGQNEPEQEEINAIPAVPTEDKEQTSIQTDEQSRQEMRNSAEQIRRQTERAEEASSRWKEHTVGRLGDDKDFGEVKSEYQNLAEDKRSEFVIGAIAGAVNAGANPEQKDKIGKEFLQFDKGLSSEYSGQLKDGVSDFKAAMEDFRSNGNPERIKNILKESVTTMSRISEQEPGVSERNVLIGRYISETMQFAKSNNIKLDFSPKELQSATGAVRMGVVAQNGIKARSELSAMDTINMDDPVTQTKMGQYMTMQALDRGVKAAKSSSTLQKVLGTDGPDAVDKMVKRTLQSESLKKHKNNPEQLKNLLQNPASMENVRTSTNIMGENISMLQNERQAAKEAKQLEKSVAKNIEKTAGNRLYA